MRLTILFIGINNEH